MCDFTKEVMEVRCFSGSMDTKIDINGTYTVLEWPCVYISGNGFESCIELSLSDDNMIGYSYGELGINLNLPESIIHDEVVVEIATLWVFLFESLHISNTCVRFICHRKTTWLHLKKKRHKNNMVAILLRQIFWYAMTQNVKLEFVYNPFR